MENRKKDHINLAFDSKLDSSDIRKGLEYEPMLAVHPSETDFLKEFDFLGKKMKFPLWISSMTGGTQWAETINRNLAKACGEFGLGMGLGSCRILLEDSSRFEDFNVRQYMTEDCPLYINFGIAQVEEMRSKGSLEQIEELNSRLKSDGLIIHVNPLQEWVQEEGDEILVPPLETVKETLDRLDMPIIVKEVGQGFGPRSMNALMKLPLEAIDFAAAGGTNFSRLEMLRKRDKLKTEDEAISHLGHTAEQMLEYARKIYDNNEDLQVKQFIISGGVKDYLHAYQLISHSPVPCVYGMASALLRHSREDYEDLRKYVLSQIKGYRLIENYVNC